MFQLPDTKTIVSGVVVAIIAAIAINQLRSISAIRRLVG